jgi:hypothetical protein
MSRLVRLRAAVRVPPLIGETNKPVWQTSSRDTLQLPVFPLGRVDAIGLVGPGEGFAFL